MYEKLLKGSFKSIGWFSLLICRCKTTENAQSLFGFLFVLGTVTTRKRHLIQKYDVMTYTIIVETAIRQRHFFVIHEKLSRMKNRAKQRCTYKKENYIIERLVKKNVFMNLEEIHKVWTARLLSRWTTVLSHLKSAHICLSTLQHLAFRSAGLISFAQTKNKCQ